MSIDSFGPLSRGGHLEKGRSFECAFNEQYQTGRLIAANDDKDQWVSAATSHRTAHVYAVKLLKEPDWLAGEPKEAMILLYLQNERDAGKKRDMKMLPYCIIRYKGYIADEISKSAYLLTNLCNGGNLANFITNYKARRREQVPEDFVWHVFRQITSALVHLQECHIVHRNVQPAHMLMTWTKGMDRTQDAPLIRLCGFGIAADTTAADYSSRSFDGTRAYQPPEIPCNGHNSDIWGLGATIHELCMGCLPISQASVRWQPSQSYSLPYICESDYYSIALQSCMAEALAWEIQHRPNARQLEDILLERCVAFEYQTANPLPEWALKRPLLSPEPYDLVGDSIAEAFDETPDEQELEEVSDDGEPLEQSEQKPMEASIEQLRALRLKALSVGPEVPTQLPVKGPVGISAPVEDLVELFYDVASEDRMDLSW